MSRLALAQPAVREKTPAKIMISAGEGGGKTETALRMARELAGPHGEILFIDTERRKALLYADRHQFIHLPWAAPFDPEELALDVLAAGDEYPVIVIDSVYSFWSGEGGVLDKADKGAPGNGQNKFAGWKVARPAHRKMVDALIDCRAHVILCCRAKVDYVQEQGANGRLQVRSLGMQPIQDDFLPAEVDLHLRMDADTHDIEVAKSRIEPIPQGDVYKGDDAVHIAGLYREWAKGGKALATADDVAEILARFDAIDDPEQRKDAKRTFVDQMGRPRWLRAERVEAARALVEDLVAAAGRSLDAMGPAGVPTTPAAAPAVGAPDPDQLAAWIEVSRRMPQLLGDKLDLFRTWLQSAEAKETGACWKPATATGLNAVIDAARYHYQQAHGGPRMWPDQELAEVTAAVAALREGDAREWADFVGVAFENLADAETPATWTDDQFTTLSTWIRIADTHLPEGTPTDDRHEHPAAAA